MQNSQENRTLRVSIIAPIIVLIALVALSIGILIKNYLTQQVLSDMQRRSELIVNTVKYIAEADSSSTELHHVLNALGSEHDVNTLYVISIADGKIIASNEPNWRDFSIAEINGLDHHRTLHNKLQSELSLPQSIAHPNGNNFTYASRLTLHNTGEKDAITDTAAIFVELDTSRATEQIEQKLQTLFIIILATVTATIVLIFLLLNIYVFTPICFILRAIKDRANGSKTISARVFRPDEIGTLARTFNDFIQIEELNKKVAQERNQELQFIFDNLPTCIWYKDNKNNILRLNRCAAVSMGKSVADIEGKNLSQISLHQANEEWQEDKSIIETGEPIINRIEKQIINGREHWIKTEKFPYSPTEHGQQRVLVLRQDITKLKQIEEKLRESEQRFQLVIEATYDGIWDWPDITEDDEYWSPQWKSLLGYEEHEIEASAKTFFAMLHPDDIPHVEAAVTAHKEQGIPFDVEYRLKNKAGEYRWFQAKGIMSVNQKTGAQRMTGSISDIQQRKESDKKLRDYNAELERSNAVLDEYAYAASHDLQSPLRGIDQIASWVIEDLEDGNLESITENLTLMRGRVQRMEKLLKDLLVYSKVGRREELIDTVNTQTLVNDIFTLAAPPPEFKLVIEDTLPTLTTLATPFEQVIRNLIGNAIKHHDKQNGFVSIGCTLLEKENQYQFSIKDNGPGIDEKYHGLVFKMFKSLKSRDEVEGSGIGLALVSKIITTYKGSIRLESEVGEGAIFYFTWPIDIKTI